jgi:hypothetical protein
LELPATGFDQVEIFDVRGQIVHQQAVNTLEKVQELNQKLLPGLYFIHLVGKTIIYYSKVIID